MSIISEFKDFVNRGNVVDMAVGVIIGGAFTTVVSSFTGNIVNPLINFVTGTTNGVPNLTVSVPGTSIVFDFGAFLSSIVNLLIVALTLFFALKLLDKAKKTALHAAGKTAGGSGECGTQQNDASKPQICPFCLEEVKPGASRCPHCTAELTAPPESRI